MSKANLTTDDRCYFLSPKGLKLRCRVVDTMDLKTRGEEQYLPVVRIINRKPRLRLEGYKGPKVRWIARSRLRKLPK